MSARKLTPKVTSKSRDFAFGHNSTMCCSTVKRPLRGNSSKLDVTQASGAPKTKQSMVQPSVEWQLECDLVYNEYLQSEMKALFIIKTIDHHLQDMKDQTAIQKDALAKREDSLGDALREMKQLQQLKQLDEVLNSSIAASEGFKAASTAINLEQVLNDLNSTLDFFCNKVQLENIKPITSQEEYDGLMKAIVDCCVALEKFKASGRDLAGTIKLGDAIKRFREVQRSVVENQCGLEDLQKKSMLDFVKSVSDMYAKDNN